MTNTVPGETGRNERIRSLQKTKKQNSKQRKDTAENGTRHREGRSELLWEYDSRAFRGRLGRRAPWVREVNQNWLS